MTKRNRFFNKTMSIFLCLALMLAYIPAMSALTASAAEAVPRIVDPSTMNEWKEFFGEDVMNTANAGGVWTDKSVFTDASAFDSKVQMTDPNSNFLVALSAIAANKSITGYSHIPTDTMLVLDISRSMGPNTEQGDNNNDAVDELITAANAAIAKLQAVNNYNRVGVVLYSGNYTSTQTANDSHSTVLLPLGRYEHNSNKYLVKDRQTFEVGNDDVTAESVKVNSGVTMGGASVSQREKEVYGGTYIQGGIHTAMREFLKVEDTTIEGDGFQAGTKRIPITVLMSDGLPTIATNDYDGTATGIGTSNMGNGGELKGELATAIPFVTQLTAAYAKEKIEEHYDRDSLFYTLGFKIEDSPVLDPDNTKDTDGHWETYLATDKDGSMQLAVDSEWVSTGWFGQGYYETIYTNIEKSDYNLTENYVNQYFQAEESLTEAFDAIVSEIILQSLYYPTQVEGGNNDLDGYIEFIDDIGQYMEVKDIKGIQLGEALFKGDNIAKNFIGGGGDLGTIENPSALGDEMIRAVKARLGIKDTSDAQKLVDDAYRAGQLAYNPATGEYSNYIGWYADADGNYMGHGTRDDEKPMDGAVFYNESYGYLGEVADGHKSSDMMYVSVQVHTRIATGTSAVIFRVPASLIPVLSYNITLTGTSLEEPGEITLDIDDTVDIDRNGDGRYDSQEKISPIRLLFEVGLKEEINELTVADIVADGYKYVEDGVYTFYTNRFNPDDLNHEHPSVAENTVAFYEPSVENERYYYTENSTVYKLVNGEYVPYTGAEHPAYGEAEFYRQYAVFEKVNNNSTNNAKINLMYEAISSVALGVAKADVEDGETPTADTTWYIPKGTIHRMFENYNHGKGGFTDETQTAVNANLTDTLIYSHYLGVELVEENMATEEKEASYYADVILGNNGKMSVEAAQGIKITKALDVTLAGRTDTFTFEITAQNETATEGSYRLVKIDKQGNKTTTDITFADGTETVEIMAGEEAYLIDLPAGASYLVKELTADEDYHVATINGEDVQNIVVTVEENVITDLDFVNTLKPPVEYGSLVLQKLVEHPFGANYQVPENIEFTFDLDFIDEDGNVDDTKTVTLKNGETVTFADVPLGTTITVTETDIPDGFTSNAVDNTVSVVIEEEKYYVVNFTNTYEPEAVNPNIILHGEKIFTGREGDAWFDSDNFTFKLQKSVNGEWVDMELTNEYGTVEKAETTVTNSDTTFDFSRFIQAESYNRRGVYAYRVIELYDENPYKGITYDTGVRWFAVHVDDVDMDGSYEITDVTGGGGIIIGENAEDAQWNVEASFHNTYAPTGSDAISIIVNKHIDDKSVQNQADSLVSKAGFEFGLYQGDRLVTVLPETSEAGEVILTLTYGASEIGRYIQYTMKEIVPEDAVPGIQYSEQEYIITILVEDDTEGGVVATVVAVENAEGAKEASGDEVTVDFTNTYDPEDATAYICGIKNLVGRDITDGEFTFELYKSEDNTFENLTLKDSKTNTGTEFTFEELTYDKAGEYYYLVKEKAGDDQYVEYDDTEYRVTVKVTDAGGVLEAEVLVNGSAENYLEFTNIYNAPTEPPTTVPTEPPTQEPTEPPTTVPTEPPTQEPTEPPTQEPTEPPTQEPTEPPTQEPTEPPTAPDVPDTGDYNNTLMWVAVMFVFSGGIGTVAYNRKKREE